MTMERPAAVKLSTLQVGGESIRYCSIGEAAAARGRRIGEIPYAIRVLVENLLRYQLLGSGGIVTQGDVDAAVNWESGRGTGVPLHVERVILPDSSGLPVLQDLAALRDAIARAGGDAEAVAPRVPVDLIVDHSLQVDRAGSPDAMDYNMRREFTRNAERYRFLKWAQGAFPSLRVFPPGTGIIHQVNLEHLAAVVIRREHEGRTIAVPDFVIGGDSHTPMVNGIGVLGWGVGGIDAEAAMLGQAYVFPVPDVVGVRLTGALPPGVMTTDLALLVTERLRKENVVGAVVEFCGPGVETLSIPERATIANMAPEYGATAGFFPVDQRTIDYLRQTRRDRAHPDFVEAYCRANDLFRSAGTPEPKYGRIIEIDLSRVELSVAGPRRPQDRLPMSAVAQDFRTRLTKPLVAGGFAASERPGGVPVQTAKGAGEITHGSIAIAAITSCTNTSNPGVMLAAGLLARKAVAAGLRPPPWVKTSLAPGSRVVTRYLQESGLLPHLEALGFHVVGYGCTTCGGKSGPLDPKIARAIEQEGLITAAVLSGNRNFEGRIQRLVRANYICSPPLVVAYALAGRIDIDLLSEPIGHDPAGAPVFLRDLWPTPEEIAPLFALAADPRLFSEVYGEVRPETVLWNSLDAPSGPRFDWDPGSTYLVEPPFFASAPDRETLPDRLSRARALAAFGDSLTTDHISPGGEIPVDSPAGQYLIRLGVEPRDFNTYVARRCNHNVMARATFANIRIKNLLVPDQEGGVTRRFPQDQRMSIFDAAQQYRDEGTPVIVLAGKEYGTGSSRDWAAKGSALLGVRAVIAESFERIHRANLVGMGILPLQFQAGQGWQQLGLTGAEEFDLANLRRGAFAGEPIEVRARRPGAEIAFTVTAQLLTESERSLIANGGLLPTVIRHFLDAGRPKRTSTSRGAAARNERSKTENT